MTLRDDLIPCVDSARDIINDFGLRPYVVLMRTRTWSGTQPGDGTATDVDVAIAPVPKVSHPSPRLIANSGGTIQEGDRMVSKISASYTEAQLTGNPLAANAEVWWVIDGDLYTIVGVPSKKNFEFRMQLRSAARGLTL